MKNRDMGHNALTCKSAPANSFTLLRHEKTTFIGVRFRDFACVLALAEARVFFCENRFEIEVETYSQIIKSELRRLPINLFRSFKVAQSAHF